MDLEMLALESREIYAVEQETSLIGLDLSHGYRRAQTRY
jgi:hypothetical protein